MNKDIKMAAGDWEAGVAGVMGLAVEIGRVGR